MKGKTLLLLIILLLLTLSSCTPTKYVTKKSISNITKTNPALWSLEDCNSIINHYKISNTDGNLLTNMPLSMVKVEAIPLNRDVVTAFARKETIQKRYSDKEFKENLKVNLEEYTSYTLDSVTSTIVIADSNFTNGYSFKIYFENISNPYRPIFLEDGYSYFFLENKKGDFSRVIKVTGLFAEEYIQLDGYLNVVITFSPFAANGKRLFVSQDLIESYKLVFNGLQNNPIVLEWNTD